jgi:hypothetical protein
MLLALFLLEWFYPVFFELRSGATPGKRAVGLTVVHADGTPVGPSASLLRNLLRALDFLPAVLRRRAGRDAHGPRFPPPRRPRRRHAGDLPRGRRQGAEAAATPPIAPPGPMTPALQQAVLAFAERSAELSARAARSSPPGGLGDGATRRGCPPPANCSASPTGSPAASRTNRRRSRDAAAQGRSPTGRSGSGARMRQQASSRPTPGLAALEACSTPWRRPATRARGAGAAPAALLRQVSGHYAMARARGYSPGLVARLHELVRRGYRQLHRPRPAGRGPLRRFAVAGFPRALRRRLGLFWLACALFFGPMLAMGLACAADPT